MAAERKWFDREASTVVCGMVGMHGRGGVVRGRARCLMPGDGS